MANEKQSNCLCENQATSNKSKRLIDADELMDSMRELYCKMLGDQDYNDGIERAIDAVDDAPIVDAVEVVRCKDCKNWMYEYCDVGLCVTDAPDIDGVQRRADDFCAYGERRTDGN